MKKIHIKLISAMAVSLTLLFALYFYQVSSVSKSSEPVLFEVSENEVGLNMVIDKLANEKIIRSAPFTKLQAKIHSLSRVYTGKFELDKSWSSKEILLALDDPTFVNEDITVQLKEGYWAKDMASKLEGVNGYKAQDYLDLWNDRTFVKSMIEKYEFLPKEILELKDVNVLLEGYLYPDTYLINPKDTKEEVTEMILNNAAAKYKTVENLINESEMSMMDIYTLASIVEYEASGETDMKKVAGVFMNRLAIDMPLQSSVTICYSLYEFETWEECESAKNNQIDSPYNTYIHKGLPPGPILNPSVAALKATLEYDENDYLFFIADVHNKEDGKVHYQKTYEEHEKVRKRLLGY